MRMSLQYQYTLDTEKERGQTALFQFYYFRGAIAPITLRLQIQGLNFGM